MTKTKLKIFIFALIVGALFIMTGQIAYATNSYYINFNGSNEYLGIANADQTGLDITGSLTIMGWYKGTDTGDYLIQFLNGAGTEGYGIHFGFRTAGHLCFKAGSWCTASGDMDTAINDNTWHHFAVTYNADDNTVAYFLDGVSDGYDTNTDPTTWTGARYFTASNGAIGGDMDEVAIFNTNLATSTIEGYSDCGLDGDEDNLVALWKFDSQDASDSHANGNDMTEYNTPTYASASLPFTNDCSTSTPPVATSTTITLDEDWYSDDLTIIKARTEIYTDSTTTPSEIRRHYLHIPFFGWVVILIPMLILGYRIILEILIRFRNDRLN